MNDLRISVEEVKTENQRAPWNGNVARSAVLTAGAKVFQVVNSTRTAVSYTRKTPEQRDDAPERRNYEWIMTSR